MTKKLIKIILITVILISIAFPVLASTVSESGIANNFKAYIQGDKSANAKLNDGTEISIEKISEENVEFLMQNNEISIKDSESNVTIQYFLIENKCIYIIEDKINSSSSINDYENAMIKPMFLSICYIATTDCLGLNSNEQLEYFEQKIMDASEYDEIDDTEIENANIVDLAKLTIKAQKNVTDELFTYETIEIKDTNEEYQYKVVLTINLDKFASNQNNQNQEGNNQEGSKEQDSKEQQKNNIPENEIQNKTNAGDNTVSNKNIPNTGKRVSIIILVIGLLAVYFYVRYTQNKDY